MATKRWKVAGVGGAVCWGIYDDVTEEISGFEVENPSTHDVRLTVTRPGKDPDVLDRSPHRTRVTALELADLGARQDGADEGEIDLPDGVILIFQTLPGHA